MTTQTIITSARTGSGIARAYIAQHGATIASGAGRTEYAARAPWGVKNPDGTWTVGACSGSRRDPRGSVVLCRAVTVA